jgi:NADH dehydrogenase
MGNAKHVVIVGGGFAGLDAARAFRGSPMQVTLVDRHNHHVFQPLLYQVATAALSPGDIASPIRWILRKQANVRVLLGAVLRIDAASNTVWLDHAEALTYDYLILAPGATHSYFGHADWARVAPGLKTLDDALAIRRRMLLAFEEAEREPDPTRKRHLLTFAIVGGGPTGVELAGALAEIARHTLRREFDSIDPESARIILLEGGASILPAFPESLRESARRSLRKLGVEVWENAIVQHIGLAARHESRRSSRSRRPRDCRTGSVSARASRDLHRRRHGELLAPDRPAAAGRGASRQATGRARGEKQPPPGRG